MIDAKELRVGNWVMVAGTGELHPIQVKAFQIAQLLNNPDMAARVLITEEWVVRLGFVPDADVNGWSIRISEHAFLWWGKYENIVRLVISVYSYPIYLKPPTYHFQFVHQLQNLYFSLTGEELKTNP